MATVSYKDVTIDNLKFTDPERIDNSYICNLYNDDDKLLYIQSPVLKVNDIVLSDDNNFIDVNTNNKHFIDFLLDMDENCIKCTFNNSERWFKKEIPYDAIENMYSEKDIYEEDKKYQLKLELPVIDNKLQCNVFNENKEIIDIDEIKNKNIVMIIHFKGLRILKNSFYLDLYVNQIKVINTDKYNILEKYSIIDDQSYIDNNIDENIFSQEIAEVLLDKEKKSKQSEIEKQISKLKEELNKLNN